MRRAMARAGRRRGAAEDAGADAEDDCRRQPAQLPGADGARSALRKAGQIDEAMQAFERAAALVPIAGGAGQPARADGGDGAGEKGSRARDRRADGAGRGRLQQRRGRAAAGRPAAAETASRAPAKLTPVYQRIAAIDPFDPEAHAMLGRLRPASATRRRRRRASSAPCIALGPVDRAAAYTDLGESYFKGGKRAEAKKQILAALEIAPGYERAQGLLLKLVEQTMKSAPDRSRCAAGRLVHADAGAAAARRRAAAAAPPTIASPACSGASSASNTTTIESGRIPQDFYGEPWGIDAPAAEQNLSRRDQDGDRDPGRGRDPADHRRQAAVRVSRGFTSSSRAACGCSPARSPILREFFARGGFAMMDDFHGPAEWADFEQQMKLLFPGPRDRRGPEGPSGLQLLLQARRLSRRSPASARFSPAARGSAAASPSTSARSSTMPAGR